MPVTYVQSVEIRCLVHVVAGERIRGRLVPGRRGLTSGCMRIVRVGVSEWGCTGTTRAQVPYNCFPENSLCDCVCIGDVRLEQHEEELGHVGHRELVLDERVREQVIVVLVLVLQDEHCLRRIEDHSCPSHRRHPPSFKNLVVEVDVQLLC